MNRITHPYLLLALAAAAPLVGVASCTKKAPVQPRQIAAAIELDQLELQLQAELERIVAATPPTTRPVSAAAPVVTTSPSTQPALPPLEALELYARGRDLLARGQRASSIALLEQARQLDPNSAEVLRQLAEAYGQGKPGDLTAIALLFEATDLAPDSIHIRLLLARHLLSANRAPDAVLQLRETTRLDDYRRRGDLSLVTDVLLARSLEQMGEKRAALLAWRVLVPKLDTVGTLGVAPELAALVQQPQLVLGRIGQLHEELGEHEKAGDAFLLASSREPEDPDWPLRAAGAYLAADRAEQAVDASLAALAIAPSEPAVQALLRQFATEPRTVKPLLQRLRNLATETNNVSTALTLVTTLDAAGRRPDADNELDRLSARHPGNYEVLRLRFDRLVMASRNNDAALALVRFVAASPRQAADIQPLLDILTRITRTPRLRVVDVQNLKVAAADEPARQWLLSRVADRYDRSVVRSSALQKAISGRPIIPEAFRDQFARLATETAVSSTQAIDELVQAAASAGDEKLARELRVRRMLLAGDAAGILKILEPAPPSDDEPHTRMVLAIAYRELGREADFEKTAFSVIAADKNYSEAYTAVFAYYLQQQRFGDALTLTQRWIDNVPDSIEPRQLQVRLFVGANRLDLAEQPLRWMLAARQDDPLVLQLASDYYRRAGKITTWIDSLQELRRANPGNLEVVGELISIFIRQGKPDEAKKIVAETRDASLTDADRLYLCAAYFGALDDDEAALAAKELALAADPTHAPAANDLAYEWSERGVNLPRALELSKMAVAAEPDNTAFIDTLGWIYYKLGDFDSAVRELSRAAELDDTAEPVHIDHLGDALYRQGKKAEASLRWKQAMQIALRLGNNRRDLANLRLQLSAKIRAFEAGLAAPVAEVPGQ